MLFAPVGRKLKEMPIRNEPAPWRNEWAPWRFTAVAAKARYRHALDEARDPAGWPDLQRFLRLWATRAFAVAQPGYYEAREAARPAPQQTYTEMRNDPLGSCSM
jgi:hypothetical protein